MNLAAITQKAWQENVLLTVMVELTYKCNLDCFFCYNDRGLSGKPLTTEQYFRFFEDLKEMQVLNLVLTGGEPLAHPDFFAIGSKARELGFAIRIKSNGHALNHRLARRIKNEVDPFGFDISLHGATAETHDRQTRVPGSFAKLMANLGVLRELGLRYRLNGTLTAWNEHEVEAMFALARDLDVPFNMNSGVTPRDNGDQEPLTISPSGHAIERAFRLAQAKNADAGNPRQRHARPDPSCDAPFESTKQCATGSSTLTIDPVGNILPCVQWRRPVGSLHERKISELWNRSAVLDEVRATAVRAKELVKSHGENGHLMGYCIGESVCQTGSPLSVYPIARSKLENRLKVVIKSGV